LTQPLLARNAAARRAFAPDELHSHMGDFVMTASNSDAPQSTPSGTPSETPTNDAGDGAQLGSTGARQGYETGHMRWILRISVALTVVALAAAGTWFATSSHTSDNPTQVAEASQPR
jgi:hypothetical protein